MRILPIVLATSLTACTTWGTTTVLGPRREVSRQLHGSPSFATTSSSSLSAGFAGARTRHVAIAGLEAGTESYSRTHCVQEAEVGYEQPFELQPVKVGREKDVLGGVLLGIAGLSVMAVAQVRSHTIFEPGDYLYEEPPSATPGMLVGGAMIAGGVGLIAYSFGSLPKAPRPEVKAGMNRWVATELVEASGCAPNDPAIAQGAATQTPTPTADDVTVRMRRLEALRASGTINDAEYQRKRREIVDGI